MSPTLAYISDVPCLLGVKTMRMAVLRLQSSALIHSGLKRPLTTHLSRIVMATVCIPKVIWILAKWISPKRRPSVLRSIVNGIEGGLCMASRAFSNIQPAIWNKTKEHLLVQTHVSRDTGMKVIKVWRVTPHAYIPRMHELWHMKYSVWSCSVMWRCFPFESWKRNKGQSNLLKCIAHAQNGIWAGTALIGWLTQTSRALAGSGMMSSIDQ